MGKTQTKGLKGLKLLLLLSVVFLIGFECGRLSRRKEIQELEAAAKSVGLWNIQLEEEVQTLREELNFYVEEDAE